jgi:hypothetical protein
VCAALLVFPAGLDSFAALSVMGHLQHVAQATHQTVIATIHQPRSAIWEMFDMVRAADLTGPSSNQEKLYASAMRTVGMQLSAQTSSTVAICCLLYFGFGVNPAPAVC